jgi:pilus assembly protein Flp/PilA
MTRIALRLLALNSDRRGVTALEYGLIAGVLVTVIATAFNVFGTGLSSAFSSISASL